MHSGRCNAMTISGCGRYLVTGGNKTLKVWPYSLQPGSKHQVSTDHVSFRSHDHDDRFSLVTQIQ